MTKKSKIFCFGDSWAVGSELIPGEQPFAHWMSQRTGLESFNRGVEGNSLGGIVRAVEREMNNISQGDLVTIIVPPDVRWYTENSGNLCTLGLDFDPNKYLEFIKDKTDFWFEYHHVLFIYTLQNLLKSKRCKFLFAHNYGRLPDFERYNFPIDKRRFLSKDSLTHILSKTKDYSWDNYNVGQYDGPVPEMFSGKYFKGNDTHPNELGHKKIANMFCEKLGV